MSKIKQGDYVYINWKLIKVLNDLEITNGKEIMLFAKIISLSKKEKACKASNDYLSDFFCTTDRNIRKYLQDLKEKGLIKVFEQKEGLKTTTRYIYPQYDKLRLAPEELFPSSDEGEEQNGNSTGTDVPEERNIHSEPAEQMNPLIIDQTRVEQNIVEENTASHNVADAPKPKPNTKQNKKVKVSEEKKKEIWKMFESGCNYNEISESTGVSKGKIYHIIEEYKEEQIKEQQDIAQRRLEIELKRFDEPEQPKELLLPQFEDFKELEFGAKGISNIDILRIIEKTYYDNKSNKDVDDVKQLVIDELQSWKYECTNIEAIKYCLDYLEVAEISNK